MSPEVQTRQCHRCLQPVSLSARRCPHCGDIQKADARRLMIILSVAGVIAIVALIVFGLYMTPLDVDEDNNVDNPPAEPPPKPAKKPPLD